MKEVNENQSLPSLILDLKFYICNDIYLQDIIELNKTDKEKSKMIKMLGKLIMMEAAYKG